MKNLTFSKISLGIAALALLAVFSLAGCGIGDIAGNNNSNSNNAATITSTVYPTVVSKSTDGSSGSVDTTAAISVIFSKEMDATTITTSTFTVSGASGTVTYDSAAKKATFTPSSALACASEYTAAITTGAKDTSGNAIANSFTWSFTTKQATPVTPTLMGGAIQGNSLNPSTNVVTTFAGTAGYAGSMDGTGSTARFNWPSGVTTDGTNLFVADASNNTIRKIVISTGVVTTLAGTAGSLGSTDGTGSTARFNSPQGITTDGTNLFVADASNNTIRKIVISTGVVTTLAGTAGSWGSTDGTGSAARFYYPNGITTDGTNLYVADTANRIIRKIVISTGVVTTLAGTAPYSGSTDGTGSAARFAYPNGITTDGTNLYVADISNHTIRKIVISTGVVTTLAGTALSYGSTDGTGSAARFWNPKGITTDGTSLYVADTQNSTIRRINAITTAPSSAPTNVTATAGNGQITFSWDSVSGATCYNLYCAEGTTVNTTTGTKIPYIASPYQLGGYWTATPITNGTTYSCIVTAVNNYGEGPASTQTSSTPAASYTLTVGKSGTGSGTVTSSPSGLSCGSTCTASVTIGTTVTLTATAASGSTFDGWSGGGCSGTGSCSVLMNSNITVTATFTATPTGGGGSSTYYWANWNCGSSSQCATVMGGSSGSTGPMCTLNDCNSWKSIYIPGAVCSTTATYTRHTGTMANGRCAQSGVDF